MAIIFRLKKQAGGLGVPESGAGATEIRVTAGQGAQFTAASIERAILDRSGMKARPRQGSITVPIAVDTELEARNADTIFGGIQGAPVTASIALDQSTLTSATISGSGTVLTVGGGNLRTAGIRAGHLIKLGGMATSANNGRWVPVLAVPTNTTLSLGPSPQDGLFLTDESADTTFTLTTSRLYTAATPRLREYYTAELYNDSKDQSQLVADARFTGLTIAVAANAPAKLTLSMLGLEDEVLDTGDAPNFDANPAEGEALLLLDGVCLKNGVVATTVESISLGLQAQGTITPLATSRKGADVGVSQFALQASMSEEVNDYAALQAAIAESTVSLFLVLGNKNAPTELVGIYAGNAAYAQANDTISDNDATLSTQASTLYGGKDSRGEAAGYSASSLVFATTYGL